jgi:sugar phosphate isomerase/epimerase
MLFAHHGGKMVPRFACADFTFPLLEHNNVLKLIRMMGFDGVDVGLFEGRSHLQPSTQFAELKKNAMRLKAQLDDNGLLAADVFLQCDNDFARYAINRIEPELREFARNWYEKTLEYANCLDCRHVTILPGVMHDEEPEKAFDLAVEELAWRVERARACGITLGFESHVGSLVPMPSEAEHLVRSVEGLTLTLDYTHFEKMGMLYSEYRVLMPYASHFHARNAAPGQLQTIAQENTIDYEDVVRSMIAENYKGFIGVEFIWMEWEKGNRVDNVSETILLKQRLCDAWNTYFS